MLIQGLLWNMSSSDDLKEELIATALPALTENVMVPFTCWSDDTNNNNIHPDVFHNATGCLRWVAWHVWDSFTMKYCRCFDLWGTLKTYQHELKKKKIAYHATIMQRSDPIIIIIIIKMCLQLALTERCVLGTWAVGNRKLGRPWEIAVASLTPSWVTSSPALQRTTLMTR